MWKLTFITFQSNYSLDNSKNILTDANDIETNSEKLFDEISSVSDIAKETIQDIEEISINYETGEGPKVDSAVHDAEKILKNIQSFNFTNITGEVDRQLENVNNLINSIELLSKPVDDLRKEIKETKDEVKDLNDKLDDLHGHTKLALEKLAERNFDRNR